MKNSQKGFAIIPLVVILALLIIGGGVYVYIHNKQRNQSAMTPDSDLKTYTSTQYGFEFKYPATWLVAETKSNEIILTSSNGEVDDITFSISPIPKGKTLNINCQPSDSEDINSIVDGFHSEECKNLENANGVRYTRGINVGMSTEQTYKERGLKGYFLNSQWSVIIYTVLTDATGNTFPSAASVFDAILQSVKFNNSSQTSSSQSISVPGMSKYIDSDFGFSFWYPSAWTVQSTATKNNYAGGTIQKTLTIAPPHDPSRRDSSDITIDEFNSPTREITIPYDRCSSMSESFIPAHRYYFDVNARTWMEEIAASTGYSAKDGSLYNTSTTTKAADVSHNTMGGLHLLSAGCVGDVIPLSAHDFLVFWYSRLSSPYYYDNLAKTIVATDPSVATPVSAVKQIQAITTEGILFGGLGTSIIDGGIWHSYNGAIYDRNGMMIVGANAAKFHSIGSGFATDGEHVYDGADIVAGADPATFTFVIEPDGYSSRFEKDKNHVWDEGKLIPGADSNTFAIVVNVQQPGDTFFQKDATHVWHYGKIIPSSDPATFVIINQAIWQAALFEADSSHVWFDGYLIPGADSKTFIVDAYNISNWTALMHDANHSYQLLNTLSTISSITIKIDGASPIPLQ